MKAVLGLDTSCYTTSAALVDIDGNILNSSRQLLNVPAGERGLQQSQALFQHVTRLPERISAVLAGYSGKICAVSASVRPRPLADSYMPVFRAGESQARSAATLLGVPFYPFSHQEGHVAAAMVDSGIDRTRPFLAVHLSGGTTEVLIASEGTLTLLAGTLDLHAGQLVDRLGVAMGMSFPAGPHLEALALRGESSGSVGVSIRNGSCSIAGAETKLRKMLSAGLPQETVAAELYDFLGRTVERMLEDAAEKTGCSQALLAGGVASSALFRILLTQRADKRRFHCALHFARPELSGDNACGIALLGADYYRKEHAHGSGEN